MVQRKEWSYRADSARVVLLDIGPEGIVTGISPWSESCLCLMGLGITGLLPQVVKLEGQLVVRIKEAAIAQVSMLCYQDLGGRSRERDGQRETLCYDECQISVTAT